MDAIARYLAQIEDYRDVPQIVESRDIEGLVKYIKSEQCQNVHFMTGAGAVIVLLDGDIEHNNTSAGIPDFRSPGTGLYDNLARLNLPYPEAVFEINYFRNNPLPFYTLAHELEPGRFRPTITHSFIRLFAEKSLLHTCFTQNIDTLERRAGIPGRKIVEAHGSFASQRCIDCKEPFDDEEMKKRVRSKEVPHCKSCGGLVKPDIVFFGESLPTAFFKGVRSLSTSDLLIVIGTSLVVHPFASLIEAVPETTPRVLINLEDAGGIGARPNDIVLYGKCDDTVQKIAEALSWNDDLHRLWEETASSVEVPPTVSEGDKDKTEDEKVNDQVDLLAQEIERNLAIDTQYKVTEIPKGDKGERSTSAAQEDGNPASKSDVKDTKDQQTAGTANPDTRDSLQGPENDQKPLKADAVSLKSDPAPTTTPASKEEGLDQKDEPVVNAETGKVSI